MLQLDPFTFEVLRHRLKMVNDEIGQIAKRMSGSEVIYEANDFSTALLDAGGRAIFLGTYLCRLSSSLHAMGKRIAPLFVNDYGMAINEGDMFITNDPWSGSAHYNDFSMAMPVFFDGEIVCWTAITMHDSDVGGPGALISNRARDKFQEPPVMPITRIVEKNELRRDIESILLRNTRTPESNVLNLRARIASLRSAAERITDCIREYGKPVFLAALQRVVDVTRTSLEHRLSELPDGTWREETFIDHDGFDKAVYKVALTMSKKKNRLIVDFDGTDKQAPGVVNCTYGGLLGGVWSAALPILCYDIDWCPAALENVIEVKCEEGTLLNAREPAAVGIASVGAIYAAGHIVRACLAKMLACSDKYRQQVLTVGRAGPQTWAFRGKTSQGRDKSLLAMYAGPGGGARSYADGLDAVGVQGSPKMTIMNIETMERGGLLLFLYRKLAPETAGAGEYRGGLTTEVAVTPHDCQGFMELSQTTQGCNHPDGKGVLGGLSGPVNSAVVCQQADIESFLAEPTAVSRDDIRSARKEAMEAKSRMQLGAGDVAIAVSAGGAGYGDPLERVPSPVIRDINLGLCTIRQARDVYGVISRRPAPGHDAVLDEEATAARREELRQNRTAASSAPSGGPPDITGQEVFRCGATLKIIAAAGDFWWACGKCGHSLGPASDNYQKHCATRVLNWREISPLNEYAFNERNFVMRQFNCPGCGLSVRVEVRQAGAPLMADIQFTREELTEALSEIEKKKSETNSNYQSSNGYDDK